MELKEIKASLDVEKELGESSYLDCFRPTHNKILLRTLSGIFLQAYVCSDSMWSFCGADTCVFLT